jgi:hypothetical protein
VQPLTEPGLAPGFVFLEQTFFAAGKKDEDGVLT